MSRKEFLQSLLPDQTSYSAARRSAKLALSGATFAEVVAGTTKLVTDNTSYTILLGLAGLASGVIAAGLYKKARKLKKTEQKSEENASEQDEFINLNKIPRTVDLVTQLAYACDYLSACDATNFEVPKPVEINLGDQTGAENIVRWGFIIEDVPKDALGLERKAYARRACVYEIVEDPDTGIDFPSLFSAQARRYGSTQLTYYEPDGKEITDPQRVNIANKLVYLVTLEAARKQEEKLKKAAES